MRRQPYTTDMVELIETPRLKVGDKLFFDRSKTKIVFRGTVAECSEYSSMRESERPKSLNIPVRRAPEKRYHRYLVEIEIPQRLVDNGFELDPDSLAEAINARILTAVMLDDIKVTLHGSI